MALFGLCLHFASFLSDQIVPPNLYCCVLESVAYGHFWTESNLMCIFFNINGFCLGSRLTCPKSPHFRGLVIFFPYLPIHYPWPLGKIGATISFPEGLENISFKCIKMRMHLYFFFKSLWNANTTHNCFLKHCLAKLIQFLIVWAIYGSFFLSSISNHILFRQVFRFYLRAFKKFRNRKKFRV